MAYDAHGWFWGPRRVRVAGTFRQADALSCDDVSLFDNVMVIVR